MKKLEIGGVYWKVVRRGSRKSCVVGDTKFAIVYKKNTIIKARPKSLGILCFKTRNMAREYAHTASKERNVGLQMVVVKVIAQTMPVTVKQLSSFGFYNIVGECFMASTFKKQKALLARGMVGKFAPLSYCGDSCRPPEGTIGIHKVKVLT